MITSNGGDYERFFVKVLGPLFQQRFGPKVVFVPGLSTDIISKLIAQKDNPQIDIVLVNMVSYVQARRLNLLQPMDPKIWTTRGELHDIAVIDGEFGAHFYSAWGLIYDKDMLAKRGMPVPPTSWLDPFDPKVADCAALYGPIGSILPVNILTVNRALGHKDDNVDAAFKKFSELGSRVRSFPPSPAAMNDLFLQRSACIALNGNAISGFVLRSESERVDWVCPKEGCMGQWVGHLPVRNAPHPNAAQVLANFLLTKEAQELMARELPGMSPTNRNAEVSDELRTRYKVLAGSEGFSKLQTADWTTVVGQLKPWLSRWQREVQK